MKINPKILVVCLASFFNSFAYSSDEETLLIYYQQSPKTPTQHRSKALPIPHNGGIQAIHVQFSTFLADLFDIALYSEEIGDLVSNLIQRDLMDSTLASEIATCVKHLSFNPKELIDARVRFLLAKVMVIKVLQLKLTNPLMFIDFLSQSEKALIEDIEVVPLIYEVFES